MRVERYAPLLLRYGIALVFLWFGFSQMSNPAQWARMIPSYVQVFGLAPTTVVMVNGIVEIVLAFLLMIGLFTRVVAVLLGLHLLHIITILGYGPNAARDLALAVATFSIALHGADEFSMDAELFGSARRLVLR